MVLCAFGRVTEISPEKAKKIASKVLFREVCEMEHRSLIPAISLRIPKLAKSLAGVRGGARITQVSGIV